MCSLSKHFIFLNILKKRKKKKKVILLKDRVMKEGVLKYLPRLGDISCHGIIIFCNQEEYQKFNLANT